MLDIDIEVDTSNAKTFAAATLGLLIGIEEQHALIETLCLPVHGHAFEEGSAAVMHPDRDTGVYPVPIFLAAVVLGFNIYLITEPCAPRFLYAQSDAPGLLLIYQLLESLLSRGSKRDHDIIIQQLASAVNDFK